MNFLHILTILFAYLIGSISTAILTCKILHYPDPRKFGSKNPGTTNVLRIAGRNVAIFVLIIDILKGAIPVWISYYLQYTTSFCTESVAVAVFLGHIYPIFFKFHGGKGVATAFGAITTMSIDFAIVMIIIWTLIILIFKYSSLAAIITSIILPIYTWYLHPQYFISIIIISILTIIRHINNIKRIWNNQETRI